MLHVIDIEKSYGVEKILHKVSLSVSRGERWGLVGPNGCGKSTLLRIIAGDEKADQGRVSFTPVDLRFGYLPQGFKFNENDTVAGFLARMEGDVERLSLELAEAASEIAAGNSTAEAQLRYDRILAGLTLASENEGRGAGVLAGLGLGHLTPDTPAAILSGGQKTRLGLAGVLLSNPQLLLLDEPTNHLDIDMLEWLEDWLGQYRNAALIVSHDRAFLDAVATGIFELDPVTHTIKAYAGNYSAYLEAKIAERERLWQQYQDQQDEIGRLKQAARHVRSLGNFRKGGKADSGDKFARGFFANRSLETLKRAKQLEHRLDKLMNEDHIQKPKPVWDLRIEFNDLQTTGRDVLTLNHCSVGYNGQALLKDLSANIRLGQRVALIGPNGCGKTTLLRTVVGLIPPVDGGFSLGTNVRPGYMTQEQEDLQPASNALQIIQGLVNLNETEARAFLSKYLFTGDDVFIPAGKLSYGERSRLGLACLVVRGCNFLLLDEPINHLDIPARIRFEQALAGFNGTILAVVHDRYFIEGFANVIWEVRDGKIQVRM